MQFLFIILFFVTSIKASENRPLIVGVEDTNNCPYICVSSNNEISGDFHKLFSSFLNKESKKFEFQSFPIKRLFKNLFNSSIDFKFPDNPNWNMDQKKNYAILYIGPVFKIEEKLLSKNKDIPSKIIKIGILRGYTFNNKAEFLKGKELKISEFNSEEYLIEALRKERIDIIQFNNLNKIEHEFTILYNHSVDYYVSTINHKELLQKFKSYIPLNNQD